MWSKVNRGNVLWGTMALAVMPLCLCSEACSPASGGDSEALVGVDENVERNEDGLTGQIPVGSVLQITANLNFRTGPSTGYRVLRVLPQGSKVETVDYTEPTNGYYKIEHNGTVGWAYGNYMSVVSTPSGGSAGVSGTLATGTVLESVTTLNFRAGPSTSYSVLDVLYEGDRVTVMDPYPENGYYKLDNQGMIGWSHGGYMRVVNGSESEPPPSSGRDAAIARAKSGVGFSYWWGHARWLPGGPTSSTAGSCTGSCPSCSHSGSYGADCSGYVGKIWQVPSGNDDLTQDSHPYSTASFNGSSSLWSTVSRSQLAKADALVYRQDGAGHIVLYESGDGWGSMWAYECKGCSAGCVYNLRTASSAYKGIRRSGY